jgi:hypothetical protein
VDLRIRTALMLYAFAVFGLFLLVAPWTPIWNRAMLALLPTSIGAWVMSGWVRGVISGLGALDLLMALQVAREFWGQMQPEEE